MNEICIQHEGGEIRYSADNNRWLAFVDGQQVADRQSLLGAQSAITVLRKKESKGEFKRHPALLSSGYGGNSDGSGVFAKCEVTSYADNTDAPSYRRDVPEAWVNIDKDAEHRSRCFHPGRAKVEITRLRAASKKNFDILEKMEELSGHIHSLEQERKKLFESLEPYTKIETK